MCMVVSAYRLVKIWNSPQFPDEFRNGHIERSIPETLTARQTWGTFAERKSHSVHTYIFINPRSRVTIQDTKTVSDKIEKGEKFNK